MYNEITWKDIKGYEGIYQISNAILIRSKHRFSRSSPMRGNILKAKKQKNGYYHVVLCKNGKKKDFYIHRLVAEAFIPNPDKKPHVNHLNGIKTDNRIENLEWVTPSENAIHACNMGVHFDIAALMHKGRRVLNTCTGEEYSSIGKAAKAVGVSHSTMRRRLVGQRRNTTCLSLIPD
jgi:hypothetical protein